MTLGSRPFFLTLALAFAATIVSWRQGRLSAAEDGTPEQHAAPEVQPAGTTHPVHIRPGPITPTVIAVLPGRIEAERVACSTCHATRSPNLAIRSGPELIEFHQGLVYRHGSLTCLSCHNTANYDTLRLADGTTLAYPETILLCAQCHGPQHRDYRNGSHGGMTGHWDLTAGPRTRNTCTNCHDVHAPAYPRVQPVFPPQDRGARQMRTRAAAQDAGTAHE